MKKSILFSVLVVGATLLQAQSITVHQTCGQNGQVVKAFPPEAAQAVDLGLSVKWANMNVGAESPEDYGDYFAWGETATKTTYNWSTYFDTSDGGGTFTKYNNDGGKTVLDPEDDAAHVNWGGSWRMPTQAEWQELLDNCTWTWTTQNGIKGYKVTSNKAGYTDKFIFLPAAGYRLESDLGFAGSNGYYWSSSLGEYYSYYAWYLLFSSGGHNLDYGYCRCSGQSVRPVLQASSISSSSSTNDTIRIYSNGCDDYQTFIGSHGSQLTMSANSDQWSHFVRWNDGNTDNPRTITTNGNADYTAIFAKYIFSITTNAEHGSISGNSSAEYLDSVLLLVVPDRGYQFIKWADGNTENPRTIEITQDTTLEAIFDYLLTGKCGKDSALTWTFEPASMALNITGKGALSENYTYGTFIKSLTIGNDITSIGYSAFYECNNLKNVIIGSSVKVLEEGAFSDCSAIETITCYSQRPPTVNQYALYGLDYSTIVYVPADYLNTYKMHDAWGLYDVRPLGAKTTETSDLTVTPAENTADVVWPAVSGAATYELVIKDKSGNVICTLVFNANGQLTQIAFNAPARNNAPQQKQASGFEFTVTGLESGTGYNLTMTSKDSSNKTLQSKTVTFTTTGNAPQGINDVQGDEVQCTKVLRDGQIFIQKGDKTYSVTGQEVR